jgi:uncharacterized damage-inducible protein DinB
MTTKNEFAAWVQPLAAAYREDRAQAVRRARSLSDGELSRPTGDEGWSVREEMLHIAASDTDFLLLFAALLRGETLDTSMFADIDARNARNLAAWQDRSMREVADELESNGLATQDLLSQLTDEDESRQPEGVPFAISQLLGGYGQHGPYHVGQIRQALGENK